MDKRCKPHYASSNLQADLYSLKALYPCFQTQHSHVLCLHYYGTRATHQPVKEGMFVHRHWLDKLTCQSEWYEVNESDGNHSAKTSILGAVWVVTPRWQHSPQLCLTQHDLLYQPVIIKPSQKVCSIPVCRVCLPLSIRPDDVRLIVVHQFQQLRHGLFLQ